MVPFFAALRFLVITLHVGDERPLHPRPVFVPAQPEHLLPARADFSARHYFKIGSLDADLHDRDYTLHHCGGIDLGTHGKLLRDVYPSPSLEEHALFECAREW